MTVSPFSRNIFSLNKSIMSLVRIHLEIESENFMANLMSVSFVHTAQHAWNKISLRLYSQRFLKMAAKARRLPTRGKKTAKFLKKSKQYAIYSMYAMLHSCVYSMSLNTLTHNSHGRYWIIWTTRPRV